MIPTIPALAVVPVIPTVPAFAAFPEPLSIPRRGPASRRPAPHGRLHPPLAQTAVGTPAHPYLATMPTTPTIPANGRSQPMRTLAIANQKGGTGKTSVAVNLAAALGAAGHRVLVVDLDPQASASAWLGATPAGRGLLDALTADSASLAPLAVPTPAPAVDLVPSSLALARAERDLADQPGGEQTLRLLLEGLPERWDFLLLDCPPHLGRLTTSALVAARELLVPVEVSTLALAGLEALLATYRRIRRRLNPTLALAGVVVCRFDARTRISHEILDTLRRDLGDAVLATVLRERVRMREASSHALPIGLYDPGGDAAADFRDLAAEIVARGAADAA